MSSTPCVMHARTTKLLRAFVRAGLLVLTCLLSDLMRAGLLHDHVPALCFCASWPASCPRACSVLLCELACFMPTCLLCAFVRAGLLHAHVPALCFCASWPASCPWACSELLCELACFMPTSLLHAFMRSGLLHAHEPALRFCASWPIKNAHCP